MKVFPEKSGDFSIASIFVQKKNLKKNQCIAIFFKNGVGIVKENYFM